MDENKILYDILKETQKDVKELRADLNRHIVTINKSISTASEPQTAFRVLVNAAKGLASILALLIAIAAYIGTHPK